MKCILCLLVFKVSSLDCGIQTKYTQQCQSGHCCSKEGWCGKSADYCDKWLGCQLDCTVHIGCRKNELMFSIGSG